MVLDVGRSRRTQEAVLTTDAKDAPRVLPSTVEATPERTSYPVWLGPKIGTKTYDFPTRFENVEMLAAQMLLPTSAVRGWLKKSGLEPASTLGFTRGLITVQHLGQPAQMDPYFEGSFAVQIRRPDGSTGWHVLEMPVTSEENRERGRRIFGYPKDMADVRLEDQGGRRVGSVRTEDGGLLFSLGVGTRAPFGWSTDRTNHNVQVLHGQQVQLESNLRGHLKPGFGHIELGEEMQRRYPGLPRHPLVLFAGRTTGAELLLSLPRDGDGRIVVPPSAEPRIL